MMNERNTGYKNVYYIRREIAEKENIVCVENRDTYEQHLPWEHYVCNYILRWLWMYKEDLKKNMQMICKTYLT